MENLRAMQGVVIDGNGKQTAFAQPGERLSWQLCAEEGVTACYVEGSCEEGFDCDCAMVLRPEIAEAQREFTAIHNYTNFWCRPVFGTDLTKLPDALVESLLLREGECWQYYLPVCDDTFKTAIRGCETGFEFYIYPNCYGLTRCEKQLAFVCAQGKDPYVLMEQCAWAAAKLLNNGLRMRSERRLPEVFEYLGWCSWDALQIRVSHEGLLQKAQEFREKSVPIHYAIIDDMWADVPALNDVPEETPFGDMVKVMHASKMRSFEGDPKRFPKGMAAAITDLKAAGIPKVGVWFPVTGYWYGFTPDGEAKKLAPYLAYAPNGKLIVSPEQDKAFALFDLFCSRIRGWGGDFVKIDNQGFHTQLRGVKPIGQTGRIIQNALDSTTGSNFDGALINCMGMPAECMFNRRNSAVSRCSDDFLPENRGWFSKHILQCAYNGLLQGQYYVNDWDMWWTDDSQAAKNSLCRAVSGGPIYVSDKIGRTRPEVLRPLAFDDGKILRCDESAMPTKDCLLGDPTKEGKVLKIRNRAGDAGVVAAFNIDGENRAVSGTVSAADVGLDVPCICYEHFTGSCVLLATGEQLPVELADNDAIRLYTVVPMAADGITLLGRIDKFIGIKAVTAQAMDTVTLYEGGSFGFVCESEVRVFSETRELPVQRKGILCTVEAERDETVLRLVKE